MSEYDNTNSFVLFRVENKQSDKHPDFSGSINHDGKEFFLDAWLNEDRNGRKYFSGKIGNPKTGQKKKEDIPF